MCVRVVKVPSATGMFPTNINFWLQHSATTLKKYIQNTNYISKKNVINKKFQTCAHFCEKVGMKMVMPFDVG